VSLGLQRLATLIRFLGWAPVALTLVAMAVRSQPFNDQELVGAAALCLLGLAIAYPIAWLVDGFAEKRNDD